MLPSLQSGFAVTLSLRGPHERRLGSSQNGLGACQWAACQHTVRPGTFDAPHEDERTDGWKGWQGDKEKQVTGKNNTWQGRVILGATITKFRIPFSGFACMTGGENPYRSEASCRRN